MIYHSIFLPISNRSSTIFAFTPVVLSQYCYGLNIFDSLKLTVISFLSFDKSTYKFASDSIFKSQITGKCVIIVSGNLNLFILWFRWMFEAIL